MIKPCDQLVPRHSRFTDELQACQVRRVTWAGLVVNTFLSALKLACGVLASSQAVLADGVHSLSDGSTDVAVLIGVRYWSRPADADHPHGHRRIETVVSMGVGLLLAAAAVAMALRALVTIQEQHVVPHCLRWRGRRRCCRIRCWPPTDGQCGRWAPGRQAQ
ncbi:MAG: cation transporter [Candidatus Brocadiae bacterium]|nr:cation transporter [Candidatus Brocadiia bacterium]